MGVTDLLKSSWRGGGAGGGTARLGTLGRRKFNK